MGLTVWHKTISCGLKPANYTRKLRHCSKKIHEDRGGIHTVCMFAGHSITESMCDLCLQTQLTQLIGTARTLPDLLEIAQQLAMPARRVAAAFAFVAQRIRPKQITGSVG
jgi:hypothetical protein